MEVEKTPLSDLFYSVYNKRLLSVEEQGVLASYLHLKPDTYILFPYFRPDGTFFFKAATYPAVDNTSGSWVITVVNDTESLIVVITAGPVSRTITPRKAYSGAKEGVTAFLDNGIAPLVAILGYFTNANRVMEVPNISTDRNAIISLAKFHELTIGGKHITYNKGVVLVDDKPMPLEDGLNVLLSLLQPPVNKIIPIKLPFLPRAHYGNRTDITLGEGAYGAVWKYTTSSNKSYALKRLPYEDVDDIPHSTIREVAALVRLKHPNIIRIIDVILEPQKIYIVLPLARGDLSKEIKAGKLDPNKIRDYSYQLVRGVEYTITLDIWNRDLKTSNVLIFPCEDDSTRDRLVITDFGLARSNNCSADQARFTKQVYTLWYKAPELLLGGKYNEQAEVWALGCIIAEMFLGKALFPGESEIDTLFRIFRTLGTPTEATWSDVKNYPNFNPLFPQWSYGLGGYKSTFGDAYDMLARILVANPNNRIDIYALIQHPYFDLLRNYVDTQPCTRAEVPSRLSCEEQLLLHETYSVPTRLLVERHTMLEWIAEIAEPYNSLRELFLAIYLIDYCIAKDNTTTRNNYQLLGSAALAIAEKLTATSIYVGINGIIAAGDYSYTPEQLISMEEYILKTTSWDLGVSTSADFLLLYSAAYPNNIRVRAEALLLVSIYSYTIIEYAPHEIALACVLLAVNYFKETFRHQAKLTPNIGVCSTLIDQVLTTIPHKENYLVRLFNRKTSTQAVRPQQLTAVPNILRKAKTAKK